MHKPATPFAAAALAAGAICSTPAPAHEPPTAAGPVGGPTYTPPVKTGRLLVKAATAADFRAQGLDPDQACARAGAAREWLAQHASKIIPGPEIAVVPVGLDQEDQAAGQLRRTGDFSLVEPDFLVTPQGNPNDQYFYRQWHLPAIRAPGAWTFAIGGEPIIIALVDTGVDLNHPDLRDNLIPGYNSASGTAQADGGEVADLNGHGTTTAGAAAATGNNVIGCAGVGWNIPIMPVRASNSPGGGAFMSDIYDGVVWAVLHGARVVSISYAGVAGPSVESMGQWCLQHGAVSIWAADNSGSDYSTFDWPSVLVVGGTDESNALAAFSSFGTAIDLVAPATHIYIPTRGGWYGSASGTSYSAPLVAGALAVAWTMDPTLSPARMMNIIINTATDLGAPGEDPVFGRGLLNVAEAVRLTSRVDFNRDGFIDFFDYQAFIDAFEAGDPRADISRDGFLDFFDVDVFLAMFEGI